MAEAVGRRGARPALSETDDVDPGLGGAMKLVSRTAARNVMAGLTFAAVLAFSAKAVLASCNSNGPCGEGGGTAKCSCSGEGTCGDFDWGEAPPQSGCGGAAGCWAQCKGESLPTYDCCEGPIR